MSEYAVELSDVSKHFGAVVAVDEVSLSVRDGEFFSLLGPSGCGKTTTLRLIAGFELPTSGEVYIGGEPQGETPPYKRPSNTVFQNYALFPHMTVYQNVAFGLEMQKTPKDETRRRVTEALEMVRLPGMECRRPNQLSGGQMQRIALARALVNHPKVLLLDEPLGALDLKLRKAMQLELKALQHQIGLTFIYVTHDQEEALTMSDRIAVMSGGRVLQLGRPEEIYEQPANRFVADFIGETNFLVGKVTAVQAGEASVIIDGTLTIHVQAPPGVTPGQETTIAIRPEKISLYAESPGPCALPGIIQEVIYIGTDMRYIVQITEHAAIIAREQNVEPDAAIRFARGDRIYLLWPAGCARLLTE